MDTLLLTIVALLTGATPETPEAAAAPLRPAAGAPGAALMERAADDLDRIRRGLKEILSRVEDARDEKDLVKLLCADEKLSRMKTLLGVAERADVALAEAVAAGDEAAAIESAAIEASKVAIARAKADALRTEAAGCIGQLAYEVGGKTRVVVQEAQELPEEAPAGGDAPEVPPADPGPYLHGFGIPSAARR
jgi:hypothetical protein